MWADSAASGRPRARRRNSSTPIATSWRARLKPSSAPTTYAAGSSPGASLQSDQSREGGLLLVLRPGRTDRLPERRDPRRERVPGMGVQPFFGNGYEPQPALVGGPRQGLPEENPLRLVHAKMHRQDLLHAPIWHRLSHQH